MGWVGVKKNSILKNNYQILTRVKDIKPQTELTQIKNKLKHVLVQLRNKVKRKC